MVITMLEAKVRMEEWERLKTGYAAMVAHLPHQIVQTYLAQNTKAPDLWQCITVWKSMEALLELRKTIDVPQAIALFRSVGSEPLGSHYEVAGSAGA